MLCVIFESLKSLRINDRENKDIYDFMIALNNRKIINGLLNYLQIPSHKFSMVRNAIGDNDVVTLKNELNQNQYSIIINKLLEPFLIHNYNNQEVIKILSSYDFGTEFSEGIKEIEIVYNASLDLGLSKDAVKISPTATRSMEYYIGTTYATFLKKDKHGESFCHGGRYNFLTKDNIDSFIGVGVTFHLTLLFDKLNGMDLIPDEFATIAPVIVSGTGSINHAMYIATRLREDGIKTELLLETNMTIEEQISYAKQKGVHVFLWTEENLDRPLEADDIIMMLNVKEPFRIEKRVCWGLFNGVQIALSSIIRDK